jgi:hypothetical protein
MRKKVRTPVAPTSFECLITRIPRAADPTVDEMLDNYARNTARPVDAIRGACLPIMSPELEPGPAPSASYDATPPIAGGAPVVGLVEGVEGLVGAARRAMVLIGERKFASAEAHLRTGLEVWDRTGVQVNSNSERKAPGGS